MDTPMSEAEAFSLLQNRRAAFTAAAAPVLVGVDIDSVSGAAAADRLLDMTIAAYEGQLYAETVARGFPRGVSSLFGDTIVSMFMKSEERRVEEEEVSTCRNRGEP